MKKPIIGLVFILLATLACSSSMGTSSGGEVRMDEAGFSSVIPNGYEMSSFFGELGIAKKGTDYSVGPYFVVFVGPAGAYNDPNPIMNNLEAENTNLSYSGNRIPVTFNGQTGLAEDFTGVTEKGVAIAGRLIVGILPDGRKVQVRGNWPANQQDTNMPVFNSILNSIKFYTPIPPTPTP